jgi:hypothetical protein
MPDGDVTVEAVYAEVLYTLTVVNGTVMTAGPYRFGETITISADPPLPGEVFERWTTNGGGTFGSANAGVTTFVMPGGNAVITANYRNISTPSPPRGNDSISIGSSSDAGIYIIGNAGIDEEKKPENISEPPEINEHIAYVRGIGENLFAPDLNLTRAEATQMFYNLLSGGDVKTTKKFPDVPDEAWYAKAVNTLAALDILKGFPDRNFYPGNIVTRAEFITIAIRFMNISVDNNKGGDSQAIKFDDVPETHWAYDFINLGAEYKWIIGYGDGRFEPDRKISRAEAVTIINRILKRYPDKSYIDNIKNHNSLIRFSDVPKTHWAYYDIMEAANTHNYIYKEDGNFEEWKTS